MNVAGTDDDADGPGSGGRLLGRRTILATSTQHGALKRDLLLGRHGFDLGDQRPVGDEARVLDVEAEALALDRGAVLFGDPGRVAGKGGVDAQANIGLDRIGSGAGTAQADLLLRGEGDVDLAG